jgi:hypothetical protein
MLDLAMTLRLWALCKGILLEIQWTLWMHLDSLLKQQRLEIMPVRRQTNTCLLTWKNALKLPVLNTSVAGTIPIQATDAGYLELML